MTTVDVRDYAQQRRIEIGKQVRQVRRSKGWTQEQVAEYLGCSRRRVNRAKKGLADLHLFEIELLTQEFNVPLTNFVNQPA